MRFSRFTLLFQIEIVFFILFLLSQNPTFAKKEKQDFAEKERIISEPDGFIVVCSSEINNEDWQLAASDDKENFLESVFFPKNWKRAGVHGIRKWALVKVPKAVSGQAITVEDFIKMKKNIQDGFEKNSTLSYQGKPIKNETYISESSNHFSTLLKVGDGRIVGSCSIIHIDDKIFLLYLYSLELDDDWIISKTREWLDKQRKGQYLGTVGNIPKKINGLSERDWFEIMEKALIAAFFGCIVFVVKQVKLHLKSR